jgi:hypothetical protein
MVETACSTECSAEQLTFWDLGRQTVTVDFAGGAVVSDAGLLAVRRLDRQLDVLAEAARRLPDPRSPLSLTHSTERILTQRVYQILGGYFDGNDAQELRHDPLFQTLCDRSPSEQQPLASGSTLNRFQHAYTRREAQKPIDQRDVIFEQRAAHLQRIQEMNRYFVELFVKTRREPPQRIVLDIDATDDPTHGDQQLSLFDGYRKQYQYKPLLVFDGDTGFPLGGHLRPGTAHDSWGTVDALREIVVALRAAWPDVPIFVRGDTGFALPEVYDFCEAENLFYALGYATNSVLRRRTQQLLNLAQAKFELYEEKQQLFASFDDYQAGTWPHPRTVIAKVEAMPQGLNRRFVVTNIRDTPQAIYHGFYVQRGNVPERPIGELKNGLQMDRLSSHRFLANAFTMQCHLLAYALVVLFREANENIPEVATAEVATLRGRLFKVGAVVKTSVRRIWFHFSSTWPRRDLLARVCDAVDDFVAELNLAPAPGIPP